MVYGTNVFIVGDSFFWDVTLVAGLQENGSTMTPSKRQGLLDPVHSLIFHRTRNIKINTVKTSNPLCLSVIYVHRNSGVTNVTGLQTALKFFYSSHKHTFLSSA